MALATTPAHAGRLSSFSAGDVLELDKKVFKKLESWRPVRRRFPRWIGEKASERYPEIAYKAERRAESYDKETRKGGADAIVFAKLRTKPDIDASDFLGACVNDRD